MPGRQVQNLWEAVRHRDLAAVKRLLDAGADPAAKNADGKVPFDIAAELEYSEVAAELLAAVGGINGRDEQGWTPLMWAIVSDDQDLLRSYLRQGANAVTGRNQTPLEVAEKRGNALKLLDIFIAERRDCANFRRDINSMLIDAVSRGTKEIVALLIAQGADIEAENDLGRTGLAEAAWRGHVDVMALLIEQGADITTRDKLGDMPITVAAGRGHKDVVALLIANGADIESRDKWGYTALARAAGEGHTHVVKFLLELSAHIEARYVGRTALTVAVDKGFANTAATLLEYGADIETTNGWGETPLISAVRSQHVDAVALLLEHDANIEAKDNRGWTALMWAKALQHEEIVDLLHAHGAQH